jgi:lysozyme family protein
VRTVTANQSAVLARVMAFEGGVVHLPTEAWVTRWGQTPAWLNEFDLPIPCTPDDAMVNYEHWLQRTQLDTVCDRDAALGLIVVDYAIHSGVKTAVKALQRALGVSADGVIGGETRKALASASAPVTARRVYAARLRLLGRLLADDPSRRMYAAGWLNRMADLAESL